MNNLPITHMTLYKHGVGFFERRAQISGQQVTLSVRVEEMNDILKSLTAIDWGGGQVLSIDYATPQSREERLAGCSIRLSDERSLQDLLASLRGRRVRLLLHGAEAFTGLLLGLDAAPERQPLGSALASLLLDDSAQVQTMPLEGVQGVEILDEQGAGDLRFFLETALAQDTHRQVTIRLTPGEHDLSVSYVAPAPTWRVSYRLVADSAAEEDEAQALLQGWGIFDNRLEEDLEGISLALVAGMPISFVYDLYQPFTPQRPELAEEERTAPGPVEFGQAVEAAKAAQLDRQTFAARGLVRAQVSALADAAPAGRRSVSAEALEQAAPVATTGEALGELFQYVIKTPVTVGRGRSAMAPILSARLGFGKDLLYNGAKMPVHPVATLRLRNETGLTLERGPVTVLEGGEYVGEALLPFTTAGGEIVVPYAVELGAKVREQNGSQREIHALYIKGHYLTIEEWHILWREYQVNNSTDAALAILVEHPRTRHYDLFDTPAPQEQTDEHLRFAVETPPHGETTLRVQERRLLTRREELRRQSAQVWQGYWRQGLLSRHDHDAVAELLALWSQIAAHERRLGEIDKEQGKVFKLQQQIQANMGALATRGKEGALRVGYVEKLQASEGRLEALAQEETRLKAAIEALNKQIEERLNAPS